MASHGRYTIRGKLADGGMAEIFLAVQHGAEGFEKPVVLKRILTAYSADPQFRNMLLDEAHISMSLQHSNIAQILDLGVATGRYFLALEMVDGWDLEKILQRAYAAGMVWPAALALHVTASVCRALAYAHAKSRDGKSLGIVHRDISPNNVLISDQGEVKLTDFGVAKAHRKREQTAAGVIKGKVAYMSPEQALGGTVDRRSDIFSVGSMLYRQMTDKLPFEAGNDMDSLIRVQKAEFTPPEQVRPTVSPAVAAIIMKAMRLSPSERYQTADELLGDVERALRGEFHSAGQTELKLWLEQLGRRDNVPSIGKRTLGAADPGGTVKDAVGTDLSAGTSFELDDLDKASSQTELASSRPRTPTPGPVGGATAEVKFREPSRRRSGFWFGVVFALAAVIGARYLINWAEREGVVGALGLGNDAAGPPPTIKPAPVPPSLPAPMPPAPPVAAPPVAPPPAAPVAAAAGDGSAAPAAEAPGRPDAAAAPPFAEKPAAEKPAGQKPADDEPDEEALLKDAVPDAESAVIGEDEAEAPARGAKPAAKPRAAKVAAGAAAKPETAILHFVTAPAGAIVKSKAHVLGRTPINLHFRTGNTYEVVFVKSGYETATRKVAVSGTKDKKISGEPEEARAGEARLLSPPPMTWAVRVGLLATALALGGPAATAAGPASLPAATAPRQVVGEVVADPALSRDQARAAVARARAKAAAASAVVREVTLPSIERLIEDAELRAASVTVPPRDDAFVQRTLNVARVYADTVAAGGDPYRTATGMMVKAYRSDWDDTLQPYALYVPRDYQPGHKVPLIVALHGAFSDHRHNLRRVFGLDNRPGETDAEASRNELGLPDVPAIVVSPFGRGELMGYDGLGGDDVMRVIADVRRAYDIDPDRITMTGLSMGGGAVWAIGLRHPELFAALAPVCAVAEFPRMVPAADRALYDSPALERLSPGALVDRAARMQVFIFHGAKDPVVSVNDSRHMVDRFRALGWLGKNVHYTEYPNVDHFAWKPAYEGAGLLRRLAAIKREPAPPAPPSPPPPPPGEAIPGLFGKSVPRQAPHIYVYGTHGTPDAVAAAKALATALADWGPMVGARFAVKGDGEVTAAERARFNLVLVGAAPLNALAAELPAPDLGGKPLGDRAYRAVVADPKRPGRFDLLMGALTPAGFARLKRFAHVNRDHFMPEPNRSPLILSD